MLLGGKWLNMREIVLRETDRGWLPIIREKNDFDEWRETGRGSFYEVTGEALDAAERMLDERDIIAAQAVPCKHEDLGSDVRRNLLTRKGYTPYCGNMDCRTMPRTQFTGTQFKCHSCGWESSYEPEFIERVKKVRQSEES